MLSTLLPSTTRFDKLARATFPLAIALLTVFMFSGNLASAQPSLVLRFPFQDNSTGTSTPSDTSLGSEVNVTLQMLNKNGVGTNLHCGANSGVAGLTMHTWSLNLSSNLSQGASGYYTAVTNSALGFGPVSSFAATWWMKQTVAPVGNILGRMFFLGNSTNATDVGLANSIGMKWQDASHLIFYVNTVSATATLPNTANFPTNSWIYVAMVYDGSKISLYEGDENTPATLLSTTASAGQVVPLAPATACLAIGDRPSKGRAFPGFVDDFRFYTGTGADANFVESVRQAATGPAGLVAVPNDGRVTLNWSALSGAASYNVKRASSSGGPYTTISTAGAVTTTTYTDTGLTDGTPYYYTVSAVNGSGIESANSATEVSATPSVPPAAPTGLAATPGNSQIALSWNASTGAATYNVKRSTTSGAEVTIATVSTTGFTDTGVVNGVPYYYVVSAINSTRAESVNSTEISSTPVGPPQAPTGLSGFAAGIGQVGLSWNPTLLATSYNVYRSTTSGGTYTKISTDGTVTTTGYTDTGASGSAAYYYKVSAVNAQGEGPLSAAISAAPLTARLRFDFSDTGTTTVDSLSGASLSIVNSSNLATDYHGAANSGVAGAGKSLDFTVNPNNAPTNGGPLASTVMNATLNSANFGSISNFTVSFWVKPDSDFFSSPDIVNMNNPRLFLLAPANFADYPGTTPSTQPGLYLKINSYDTGPESGQLKVFLGTGGNTPEYVTPTGSFVSAPGLWSFVAITYDGAALKVYSATQTNAANTAGGLILNAATAAQALNFSTNGNLLLGNRGDLKKSIDARMADFRFYSGAADSNGVENIRLLAANPPASLAASGGNNQVSLSWTAVSGATSYNVKRASASGGPYTTLSTPGSVTTTSFVDSTAANNNTYYYVVSAATPYGESANSVEATATASCTPPPTAGNNGPICAGSTLNLTASSVAGATYTWTGPNGFTSSDQNPSIPGATTAASGVYSVTVTVGACTSAPATTTVVVNATPSAPTAANNGPLCAGSTLNLTASTVPGATYVWTGPNGFTSTAQNPSIANATTDASGSYSVYALVNGCASPAGTTVATVSPVPSAPVAGNNGPISAGATLNLTASTIPGATYAWTGPNGFTSTDQNPSIANATTNASGLYSVTVTVGVCASPAGTTMVVVNSAPVTLTIQPTGTNVTLGWSAGTLQSATNVLGPWSDVTNATPPSYQTAPAEPQQFFRVKVQ